MDRKFINAIKKVNKKCKPIMPSQLLKEMKIDDIESFEFNENIFIALVVNTFVNELNKVWHCRWFA